MAVAAIYARVSSDKQREKNTIASQTEALIFARRRGFQVPDEWVFEDEGYSGATLERPGLERVRDLAAEGQVDAVLVYAADRLSRKYAYQILLIEELARHGVETVFLQAPQTATAEDQLLLQFQGMIAEYERAQILERSRRGKRHRARQGQISVLSGAPYGYRYVRKSDDAVAYYEILEAEASVVRLVYDRYTVDGMSIGGITRLLNEQGVPTRKQISRWERSTVWAMLRNPAYKGAACFGKTRSAPRQRVTRPVASARRHRHTQQRAPRAVARRLDRHCSARHYRRGDLRAGAGTAGTEQDSRAATDNQTERRAGPGVVQQVRLRPVAHVDPVERPHHPLLSLHRLGRLAAARRPGLR